MPPPLLDPLSAIITLATRLVLLAYMEVQEELRERYIQRIEAYLREDNPTTTLDLHAHWELSALFSHFANQ